MFFIYIIWNSYPFLVYTPLENNNKFTKTDCYESFSMPKKFIKLSHYYPNGPLYLLVMVGYKLKSFIYGFKSKNLQFTYFLKRIDGNCISSLVFTSLGNDFIQMDISISIYLFGIWHKMALIKYSFDALYRPGFYKLLDKNHHFGLYVQVFPYLKQYLQPITCSWNDVISYINSLKYRDGHICLITENNHAIKIKPDYEGFALNGLITGFRIEIFKYGIFHDAQKVLAFECNKNEISLNDEIIFILDEKDVEINFYVAYQQYRLDFEEKFMRFKSSNIKVLNIDLLDDLTNDEKIVFLIKKNIQNITCPDFSSRTLYKSQSGNVYYAQENKTIEIAQGVRHFQNIPHSRFNPCED